MAPRGQKINGALVGQLRTQTLKITQAEMASRLGIHWVTQSNIENGKALVSLELVERIADVTGASRSDLLGEPDDGEAALYEDADFSRDDYALFGALAARFIRAKALNATLGRVLESEGSAIPTFVLAGVCCLLLATGWTL